MDFKRFLLKNMVLDVRDKHKEVLRPFYHILISEFYGDILTQIEFGKINGIDLGYPSVEELLEIVMEK